MKIALVIERMDPSRGGRETSTAQIATALCERGHDVTIICQECNWPEAGDVTLKPQVRRGWSRAAKLANFVADVQACMKAEKFDVTHSMLPIPSADIYQPRGGTAPAQAASSLRRRGAIAGAMSRLGLLFNARRQKTAALERRLVKQGKTLFLPGSEMVAREFETHYGLRENVRVVYNAVDVPDVSAEQRQAWRIEQRASLGLAEGDTLFLTIATNYELKGVEFAIRAIAELNGRAGQGKCHLLAVGRDSAPAYRSQAQTLGVSGEVHFAPACKDIFKWYAAADAVILLSWYDACSRVVLEATRWGIPSITTQYNGAAEALAGGGGLVVESPADVAGIVKACAELGDPEKRKRRSQVCMEVAPSLGMARQIDELERIYLEIAGNAGR